MAALLMEGHWLQRLLHRQSSACVQFVKAVMTRWPNAVLQFEDFNMEHAQPLLERYRSHHLVFNDDIQVRQVLLAGSLSKVVTTCNVQVVNGECRTPCLDGKPRSGFGAHEWFELAAGHGGDGSGGSVRRDEGEGPAEERAEGAALRCCGGWQRRHGRRPHDLPG